MHFVMWRSANVGFVVSGWTFLTNHAHVLLCIAHDPSIRLRDIAAAVGITERAAQKIVADLVAEGYVERVRKGRRNEYTINATRRLRHPLARDHEVGEILDVLAVGDPPDFGAWRLRDALEQHAAVPTVAATGRSAPGGR